MKELSTTGDNKKRDNQSLTLTSTNKRNIYDMFLGFPTKVRQVMSFTPVGQTGKTFPSSLQ